ncbi:MAG: M48 family metallopeptidase [Candidatus Sulfopaludibacter sp.]|nr:M48 family metallopeptidase [Candidatus Sulfopaludibacter sp.]
MYYRAVAALSLIFTAGALCASDQKKDDPNQIGNRNVGKGINFYSMEKEMALGRQLAQEVRRQAKILDDPLITEYVNRVGQNLVRNSDAKIPFTFEVIEGPEVNAFALPGGYVFVYTGLIKMADEEDEFAGALAHEIAHVAARHMTRNATKGQLAQIGTIPVGILLGGWGGYAARQAAGGVGIPLSLLRFERKDETEADYLGVQYMYAAGYDPNGAISIFEKLEALERNQPGAISRLFATHPMDADRIAKTQQEIQKILVSRSEYVVTTSEYTRIRERLMTQEAGRKTDPAGNRPKLKIGPAPDDRPTIRR